MLRFFIRITLKIIHFLISKTVFKINNFNDLLF